MHYAYVTTEFLPALHHTHTCTLYMCRGTGYMLKNENRLLKGTVKEERDFLKDDALSVVAFTYRFIHNRLYCILLFLLYTDSLQASLLYEAFHSLSVLSPH